MQFERTLIVAEDGAYVSYLEGCTAPSFDENQLHAAVVELSAGAGAEIKYSTVQNWCAPSLDPTMFLQHSRPSQSSKSTRTVCRTLAPP